MRALATLHESFLMADSKILIVDDDPAVTAAASGVLQSRGYPIAVAPRIFSRTMRLFSSTKTSFGSNFSSSLIS